MSDKIQRWLDIRKSMVPEIKPDKAALLIIDMQEYQVRKDWGAYKITDYGVPGMLDYFMEQTATVAEPNIKKLIDFFRAQNLRIIYTMYCSFDKGGSDLPQAARALNRRAQRRVGDVVFPPVNHPGSKIIDLLKPEDRDLVIVKNTSSVFTATKLEFILKNMEIEQLFVTGVVTNMCVEGSARTAFELGFDVFLIDDACAAWSPEIHQHTLQSFSLLFGHVLTTEGALSELREKISR
ncbi:MAG: cysteine hydrolase [Deltaproteobacteria bacterium]|nr:cysteine hydrolase [Deltaproteobacteria bacterium]